MSNIERPPSFSFHVKGDQQDEHTVPEPVLVQILENAQRAFPEQIIDVTDIRDLDLSSLDLHTVRHGPMILKAVPALSFEPGLDETSQLLCVEHGELALDVFAPTREALLTELNEQIAMLWTEYALTEDQTLDAVARKLKHALLATFTEVPDAA